MLANPICQSKHENRTILKFEDDTVIGDNESSHGSVIDEFVTWCDESFLELNISKTKDIIIDFRTHASIYETTTIKQSRKLHVSWDSHRL